MNDNLNRILAVWDRLTAEQKRRVAAVIAALEEANRHERAGS